MPLRRVVGFAVTFMAAMVLPLASLAITPPSRPVNLSESPEDKAERLRKLSQIPFVQLEVEFGNDGRPFEYLPRFCYFDAIIRRSFQRSDLLAVGARIRVQATCRTSDEPYMVEISPGVRVDLLPSPNVRDVVQGSLLQMHLLPAYGPADGFDKIGPVVVLKALSDAPADDSAGAAHRASHLDDYNRLDRNGPFGPGNPPEFPLTDVVVTYKDSGQPGRLFRAYYQGRMWRMRLEELGVSDPKVPAIINDALAQTETWVWDQAQTYAVQMTGYKTRFGKVVPYWKPIFEAQGTDTVAGHRCTKYYVRSDIPTFDSVNVCMTSEGVVLRRSDPNGRRSEAVAVEYKPVNREQVIIPEGYRKQNP